MGTNPFDKALSSQTGGGEPKTLASLQAHIGGLVRQCEATRQNHREAWNDHKRSHHERRFEAALEREASDGYFYPPRLKALRDAEDDARFAYLTHFDQLLELLTHEEYLRGRRAWDRKHNPQPVAATPPVPKVGMTPRKIWGILVALFVGVCDIAALTGGPGGILIVMVSPLAWGFIFGMPFLFTDWSNAKGGRSV